jgi:hypothetical protein
LRVLRAAFYAGAVLGLADALTTWFVLDHLAGGQEANPVHGPLIATYGVAAVMTVKVLANTVVFWLLARRLAGIRMWEPWRPAWWQRATHRLPDLQRVWIRCGQVELAVALVAMALVVANNVHVATQVA